MVYPSTSRPAPSHNVLSKCGWNQGNGETFIQYTVVVRKVGADCTTKVNAFIRFLVKGSQLEFGG